MWLAVTGLLAVTVIPIFGSNEWWVRALDLPRLQFALGLGLVLGLGLSARNRSRLFIPVLALLGLLAQGWHLYPLSPLGPREMALAPRDATASRVRVLAANVLMENRDYDRLMKMVRILSPDVLLLMETDQAWVDGIEPLLAEYPTVLRAPQENYYGMVFATRLRTDEARIVRLTAAPTPAVIAQLRDGADRRFAFLGLHPKPPVVGEDTEERDAQLLYSALFARSAELPTVLAGDLNMAAWSHSARRMRWAGGYLSPRAGRGFYNSFDIDSLLLRVPIDHMMLSPDVVLQGFALSPDFGSDHYPVVGDLSFDPELAARLNRTPDPLPDAERAKIEAEVARYAEGLERLRSPEEEAAEGTPER